MTIYLLIADDHPFVRESLRLTFEETDIQPVAEAGNGQEAFEELQQHADAVDVALIDIHMPVSDGFQFLRLVRAAGLSTPVVMYSTSTDAEFVAACRALGARGLVEKGCDSDVLRAAIRSVAGGGVAWKDAPHHALPGPVHTCDSQGKAH
jgi:DNA-binding NarL/FixJ family response regulator